MPDVAELVITAVIVFAVIGVGIMALSSAEDTSGASSSVLRTDQTVELGTAGSYATIDDSVGRDETVYDSLGYAVNLTGASDSYVASKSPFEVASDDTWSVCTWAYVDAEASSATMTAVSVDGRVIIEYNGTAGNWSAWYYDESTTDSWLVNVSAPHQPASFRLICASHNATHLSISRGTTEGEAVNTSDGPNIVDAPVESSTWNGRLDELRSFDDPLSASQKQQWNDSPVGPLPDSNHTARVYFDHRDASTQPIYFTDTSLEQSNVSFSDGLDGSEMDGQSFINDIIGSTDYVWDTDGPRIYVVEGGELDGAPVAFIDYTYYPFEGAQDKWSRDLTRALNMATLAPTIFLLIVVVGYLVLLRGR